MVLGSQLPGKWTDMDRPEIDLRPTLPSRNCPDENFTNDIFKRSALKRSDSEDKRALGSMKRKKAAQPFNEMKKRFESKRAGTPFNEMKRIVKKQIIKKQERRKKEDEPMQYNYQNELTTEGKLLKHLIFPFFILLESGSDFFFQCSFVILSHLKLKKVI